MPPEEAAAILSTRRQRRYTSARREGDRCRLVRHVAVCPCCGRNSPAYADFLSPTEDGREPGIPAKRIREWGAGISFFPEDDELRFNAPWNEESFICPRCAGAAREDEEDWEVSVRWERDRVTMTVYECTPRDITDCLVQATREKYRLRLPLKETVVFALGKGRTVLTVSDSADRPLKIRDVSEPNLHWSCSFTSRILTISAAARRKLAQAFAAAGGAPLPFVRAEMTPERFLALCRFRGYGRDFYDALPLDRAGNLDRSFRTAARRMRDIRSLPRIFRESGLPDKKSIRRLFFETRPQLFWYCREAAVLWPMLGDVNVFRAFLNKSTGQEVLAFLHFSPSAAVWFRDYAAERGGRGLASLLSKREGLEQLLFSAVRYAAGSEAYRRKVRRSWTVGQTPTVRLSFDKDVTGAFTVADPGTADG